MTVNNKVHFCLSFPIDFFNYDSQVITGLPSSVRGKWLKLDFFYINTHTHDEPYYFMKKKLKIHIK